MILAQQELLHFLQHGHCRTRTLGVHSAGSLVQCLMLVLPKVALSKQEGRQSGQNRCPPFAQLPAENRIGGAVIEAWALPSLSIIIIAPLPLYHYPTHLIECLVLHGQVL